MNEHDQRAQFREAPEPEEGTRTTPKIVLVWIAILIVWGVGYYAWQIGKPMLGGDSRTPVAAAHQESTPAKNSGSDNADGADAPASADAPDSDAPDASGSDSSDASGSGSSDTSDSDASGSSQPPEDSEPSTSTAAAEPDGEAIFSAQCSSCHQATGKGVPGAFPPLVGSQWLQADPGIPVAIVHDGLQGEIEVAGDTFEGVMPPLGDQLSNEEIAAVLSFARSEWGNDASAVSPDTVAEHEERFGDRGSWSAEELTEVFGEH